MDSRELFFQAEELFSASEFETLTLLLDRESRADPTAVAIPFWRGRLAESRGEAAEAVRFFEEAVKEEPETPLFHMHLAQALEQLHARTFMTSLEDDPVLLDRTEKTWLETLRLAPVNGPYKAGYADFLAGRRRFEEALALINEARQACPAHEEIHRLWRRINLKTGCHLATTAGGNLEFGLNCLQAVLRELPDLHDAALFAGICCRKLGRKEEARAYFERCCSLIREGRAEPDPMPFHDLAEMLREDGRLEDARQIVVSGLQFDPQSPALQGLLENLSRQAAPQRTAPVILTAGPEKKTRPVSRPEPSTPAKSEPTVDTVSESLRQRLRDTLAGPDSRSWASFLAEQKPGKTDAFSFFTLAMEEGFFFGNDPDRKRFLAVSSWVLQNLAESPGWLTGRTEFLQTWIQRLSDLGHRWIDPDSGSLIATDSAFAEYVGQWRDLLTRESVWAQLAETPFIDWLKRRSDFWKEELAFFILHYRPAAGRALLRFLLSLAHLDKGFAEQIQWLPELISGITGRYPEALTTIPAWLEPDARNNPAWDSLRLAIRERLGDLPKKAVSASPKAIGPEELTVEGVFRLALEEVLGDEVITREETEILRSLRDYLEIPEPQYQQIFREVTERASQRQLVRLNRDFSAPEFLYRLLLKTMEDGQVTPAEKTLIRKTATALTIDQQTFNEQYWRAEGEFRRRLVAVRAAATGLPEEDPVLRRFRKAGKLCGRVRELLSDSRLEERRTLIASGTRIKVGQGLTAFFVFEPAVFPLPVLGLAVPAGDEARALAYLQGTQFDLYSLVDFSTIDLSRGCHDQAPLLTLVNADLEATLSIPTTVLAGSWEGFAEGLDKKRGEFVVALVQAIGGEPLTVLPLRGGIDFTGTFSHALRQIGNRTEESIRFLKRHLEQSPEVHGTRYYLGLAYATLAGQQKKSGEYHALARQMYDEELALNSPCVKSLAGIGLLYKASENWKEAEPWFRHALDLAPTNVPVLLNLATTVFHRIGEKQIGTPPMEEAIDLLARAWGLSPVHPNTRNLVSEWSRLFHRDLGREFRSRPVRLSWP